MANPRVELIRPGVIELLLQFLPQFVTPLDKAIAVQKELSRAATDAGGDELKFTGAVNAVVEGHRAGEYTLGGVQPKVNVPSGDRRRQKARVCAGRPNGMEPANDLRGN